MAQGLVSFGGLDQSLLQGGSYTLSHGISPSAINITMAPQTTLRNQHGTVTFSFGSTQISIPDCKVDSATLTGGDSGYVLSVVLLDKRWKWAFGHISGEYNVLKGDDDVVPASGSSGYSPGAIEFVEGTEKSAKDLFKLLFEAMGENSFDTSKVSAEIRPYVNWDWTNPASAMADLADKCGCRVVLKTDGKVSIEPAGEGANLPRNLTKSFSEGADVPEGPDNVTVTCGRSVAQADFPLEAVGRELDGSIVPIDDLSYKPTDGWSSVDLDDFNQISDQKQRELAKATVFKLYRIKESGIAGALGSEGEKYSELWQILPLRSTQIETATGDEGVVGPKPAQVFGVYYDESKEVPNDDGSNSVAELKPLGKDEDTDKAMLINDGFSLDTRTGMVRFSKPIYKFNDGFSMAEADLRLRVAVPFKEKETREVVRAGYRKGTGQRAGTKDKIIRAEDLSHQIVIQYDDSYSPNSVLDNRKSLEAELKKLAEAEIRTYQTRTPQNATYAGLHKIEPDGAINAVSWQVGLAGATTQAFRNNDKALEVASYREQRYHERVSKMLRERSATLSSQRKELRDL